jgi:hypothetical protein
MNYENRRPIRAAKEGGKNGWQKWVAKMGGKSVHIGNFENGKWDTKIVSD